MTDIVDKTHRLYKPMGASYVGQPSWTWTFPSDAKLRLAYISTDKDIWEYLGPRYSFIGFDESTFHTDPLRAAEMKCRWWIDGKHVCRPAIEAELQRPETDEFFKELWCYHSWGHHLRVVLRACVEVAS